MPKLVPKIVVRAGFNSPSQPPVELVMDVEPEHEKLEIIQEMNKADYLEVFTRYYPTEGN